MAGTAVVQRPQPGELGRQVRLIRTGFGDVHVVIESEKTVKDGLFEDELGRATVSLSRLGIAVAEVSDD